MRYTITTLVVSASKSFTGLLLSHDYHCVPLISGLSSFVRIACIFLISFVLTFLLIVRQLHDFECQQEVYYHACAIICFFLRIYSVVLLIIFEAFGQFKLELKASFVIVYCSSLGLTFHGF